MMVMMIITMAVQRKKLKIVMQVRNGGCDDVTWEKIPAKFHPNLIWNDRVLGFFEKVAQQQQEE